MATFQEQVMALTGITISSSGTNPTEAQLTQFLRDGVLDVTDKWLIGHPQDADLFARIEDDITANDTIDFNGAQIISVLREDGINNQWRPCRKISTSQQYSVADTESLSFASKINPVYMIGNNGKISVFPALAGGGADSARVYYVNHIPVNYVPQPLAYSDTTIAFFPQNKHRLVVLYAAIQSLQTAMSNSIISLSITSPATPVLSAITFTSIDSALDASAPIFTTATVSAASTYTGSAPSYTNQVAAPDFSQVNTYIDTSQDAELANTKLQEINAQLQEMNAKMQDSLNAFNKENVAYQSAIQESMQEMQASNQTNLAKAQADLQLALSNKDRDLQRQLQNAVNDMQAIVAGNQAILTKYQAEVADYQAEVGKEIQENTTKTQQYQGLYVQLLQQYNGAFQVVQPQQQGGR